MHRTVIMPIMRGALSGCETHRKRSAKPVAILMDLPGPKFRIGDLPDDFRKLAEGAIVRLVAEGGIAEEEGEAREGSNVLPVRNPELLQALRVGEPVFLADGSIELCVKTTTATQFDARWSSAAPCVPGPASTYRNRL